MSIEVLLVGLFLIAIITSLLSYLLFDFWAGLKGAPFVPTSEKIIDDLLIKAKLKKGDRFLELGSGDGRVVRREVKKFKVKGVGIDLNPTLILLSKLLVKLQGLSDVQFKRMDIFTKICSVELRQSEVVFIFLMPKTVEKLKEKLLQEARNKLIISHGFDFKGWDKYLVDKIDRRTFSTYYYKL